MLIDNCFLGNAQISVKFHTEFVTVKLYFRFISVSLLLSLVLASAPTLSPTMMSVKPITLSRLKYNFPVYLFRLFHPFSFCSPEKQPNFPNLLEMHHLNGLHQSKKKKPRESSLLRTTLMLPKILFYVRFLSSPNHIDTSSLSSRYIRLCQRG